MRRVKKIIVIIISCVSLLDLWAQNESVPIELIIEDIFTELSEEMEEEIDFSGYYDDLYTIAQSPVNLNTATQEQLKDLFFLTDIQIENILFYIYQYGTMHTIYELRLIEGLEEKDIRRMLPFVYVGKTLPKEEKIYFRDIFKYGKNNIYFRIDGNVEKSKGYIENPEDDTSPAYAGSPLYHSLKYRFQYRDRIFFGLTAEKDAGEPFIHQKKEYDFLSAHIQLNRVGKFKTITLGDFRANFGEGLVVSTDFSMGRTSQVLNTNQSRAGLKKYTSTDEYNFFRGIGATVALGKFDITAFYSNKMIDGDVIDGTFSGIYKTGLHRTENERNKKHTVNQQVAGANITYGNLYYQIGITTVHTFLDQYLQPETLPYNVHAFAGDRQTTAGIHYRFRLYKLNIFGETAIIDNLSLATVNGISFMPFSRMGLMTIYRNYDYRYDTFYANGFGGGKTNNEEGFYLGAEVYPFRKWKMSAYVDAGKSPWLKYRVYAPSVSSSYLLNTEYNLNKNTSMQWRITHKDKEQNYTLSDVPVYQLMTHRKTELRYTLNYIVGNFSFRAVINVNRVEKTNLDATYGFSALQDVSYIFKRIPLRVDFRYQFFDAEDYENRIYSCEKDILYAFSVPMNYGLGSRYYVNLKYDAGKNISLWLKMAQTVYADNRTHMGSGNDRIEGNRKTTIRGMLRWKF